VSYRPHYTKGDWKAICDICGREFKGSQLRQRWDGFKVCKDDFEFRQPQDFVRGVVDTQVPPWTRPEPQDQFVTTDFIICEDGIPNYLLIEGITNTPLETES
jgi:hypothetical protein